MSLRKQWILNILMVLLSWLSLPLLGSGNIKRFFPSTLLIGILEILHARIGKKKKYWAFYNKPKSNLFGEMPFDIGPFIFTSIWTLKSAYGNFRKYIFINAIIHAIFAYPFTFFAKKVRYYTLVRFNNFQFFLYFFFKAFLLYWFQYLFEEKIMFKQRK
ncbi:hypothetical protein MKY20_14980 [Cytobacillus sp. FSL W8-0315]|uniref:hypothetical protein n=1 Tax=Cytobacillus sp. FSL W8-0315 TaxID=2921600 RepID=UPI0030F7BD91